MTPIQMFLGLYAHFFSSDLEAALLEGRNFKIIGAFMRYHAQLIDEDITPNNLLRAYNDLRASVKSYILKYDNFKYDFPIGTVTGSKDIFNEKLVEEFNDYFSKFIDAYNFLSAVLGDENDDEQIGKYRELKDLLIEYNNALSHLIIGAFQNKNSVINNYKRARNHLYRGTLDAYKYSIVIQHPILDKKHAQWSNYKKVRVREALDTGINSTPIEVIDDYNRLSTMLYN